MTDPKKKKQSIDGIFDDFERRKAEAARARGAQEQAAAKFRTTVAAVLSQEVIPKLEELQTAFENRDCRVELVQEGPGVPAPSLPRASSFPEPRVTLKVWPPNQGGFSVPLEIVFTCSTHEKIEAYVTIKRHRGARAPTDVRQTLDLEKLDADYVENLVIDQVQSMLADHVSY